ncbi:hypothetical protein AB2L27_09080 [Kineococcus sp. LSe6-4]|uniref:Uncharacterized protein n=1 Tax=Kineococcus halophytocola TaxID=3234027 RepID=A0ABV4H3F0_9ACTN
MTVTTERAGTATGLDAELDRLLGAAPPAPAPGRTTPTLPAGPLCLCWPDETPA